MINIIFVEFKNQAVLPLGYITHKMPTSTPIFCPKGLSRFKYSKNLDKWKVLGSEDI